VSRGSFPFDLPGAVPLSPTEESPTSPHSVGSSLASLGLDTPHRAGTGAGGDAGGGGVGGGGGRAAAAGSTESPGSLHSAGRVGGMSRVLCVTPLGVVAGAATAAGGASAGSGAVGGGPTSGAGPEAGVGAGAAVSSADDGGVAVTADAAPICDYLVEFRAPLCGLQAAVLAACHLYGRGFV
jgi:hypothetical protein